MNGDGGEPPWCELFAEYSVRIQSRDELESRGLSSPVLNELIADLETELYRRDQATKAQRADGGK